MRTLRFIGMAIIAVIMSVNFTACSDDDEDETATNPLIGTWQEVDNPNYNIWTFKADGTGTEQEYYQGNWEDPYSFTYTYDSKTSILVINYGEHAGEDEIDSYDVTIDGSTMKTFVRVFGFETTWKKK